MRKNIQKFATALMQAVAVMPIAAILMGVGYWLDPTGWGANSAVAGILIQAGAAILDNLGMIFALAISFGLAEDKNGAAALSGFIGFTVVKNLLSPGVIAVLRGIAADAIPKSDGFNKIGNGNVFVGILVGILAAWCYNHFHNVKLPAFLAFFSGRRLVPIVTSLLAIVLAFVLYFVWPLLFSGLTSFGESIVKLGPVGAGIYAFFNRLLIPTGLHHALNNIFWFDTVGINDIPNFLGGAKSIAEGTGIPGVTGMYQAGFFPVMMFGLPAAALAMFLTAKDSRKKIVASLMIAGALASFFTGVTEPLEFSFMFVAPALYAVHAVLTGISVYIAASLHWMAGFGFSAGLVDMALSAQNPLGTQWYMLLVQGLVFGALYFAVFYFGIKFFKFKTPGREDDDDQEAEKALVLSNNNFTEVASAILEGVGGKENVTSIDNCITRLRLEVKDYTLVNEKKLKAAGAAGVVRPSKTSVQVIIGTQVQFVADEFKKLAR